MMLFGLGNLFYVSILLVNAIAILSEDRFLARIGWGNAQSDPGFGASNDTTSVKAKIVNLIASVRTLMRSESDFPYGPAIHGLVRKRNGVNQTTVPLIAINTLVIAYELVLG
ncbi:hypothetical protein MMC16_000301 [Acarospora aff. strigata]|nr:hypothetical protein [Acarospora aff. strigata]